MSWFGFGSSSSFKKRGGKHDGTSSPKKFGVKSPTAGPDADDGDVTDNNTMAAKMITLDSARRRRADEGAIFTSTVCPPGSGLQNSCELPFGFVWTPMAVCNEKIVVTTTTTNKNDDDGDDDDEEEEESEEEEEEENIKKPPACHVVKCESDALPPVLCLACLTYLSPFAEVDFETGVWVCPLCEHENVVPLDELEDDNSPIRTALTSPMVEYRQPAESLSRSGGDGDDDNVDVYDYCTYVLVVDKNLSPSDGHAIVPAVEACLHDAPKGQKIRIGLVVFGDKVATYQLGISSGLASADIFSLNDDEEDGDDGDEGLLEKRSYLLEIEDGEDTLTILRTCLSSVFGVEVDESSTTKTSQQPSSGLSRMDILRSRKDARVRKEQFGAGNNKENSNTNIKAVESPWVKHRKLSKEGHPTRCTGEAIQCALDLAGLDLPTPSRTSRIILFTNGCPNSGEGSVVAAPGPGTRRAGSGKRSAHDIVDADLLRKGIEYYDTVANFAVSSGIGFDVFCSGSNELALPAYQALVEPSGGYVIPQPSLSSDHLSRNLKFLLTTNFMSRSRNIPEELDDGMGGPECILDIRTDGFISPTQLCGSGEVLPGQATRMVENERSAFATGAALAAEHDIETKKFPLTEALELSLTRLQVGRVDPLSTFAVLLEVNDSVSEDDEFAFFQTVVRYVSRTGREEVTRVCSYKIPIAEDVNEYISGLDDEVVSVMLAKAAVYRALHGRDETENTRDITASGDTITQEKLAYETQLDLDATVQRISGAFRLLGLEKKVKSLSISDPESKSSPSPESSIDFAFPPELKDTLSRLYHLRRGPLVSPGPMRSMDDRAEMRVLFLRFPLEDCILMMKPSIWSTGAVGGVSSAWDVMLDFPPETLIVWDSSIVAADFHDAVFVWSGKSCAIPRYDGIRQNFEDFLVERSIDRFPAPELHVLVDGDSMCRRFTTRLAPSHSDPDEHQLLHFPALSTLTPDQLRDLRSKFMFYSPENDPSFRKWFWSVSSASNASREDGRSLCE